MSEFRANDGVVGEYDKLPIIILQTIGAKSGGIPPAPKGIGHVLAWVSAPTTQIYFIAPLGAPHAASTHHCLLRLHLTMVLGWDRASRQAKRTLR